MTTAAAVPAPVPDLDVARKVLAAQPFSALLGARLEVFEPGRAVLALDIREAVIRHKETFTERLIEAARQANATDPEALGRQLAVLFEGSRALATSMDSLRTIRDARTAALVLIDAATTSPA